MNEFGASTNKHTVTQKLKIYKSSEKDLTSLVLIYHVDKKKRQILEGDKIMGTATLL